MNNAWARATNNAPDCLSIKKKPLNFLLKYEKLTKSCPNSNEAMLEWSGGHRTMFRPASLGTNSLGLVYE